MLNEPNVALCLSIVDLARIAAARLTVADAALGFARLSAPQRTALHTQALRWEEVATGLLALWRTLPRGPARQLTTMARSDDDLLLLALAAAPQIDRSMDRAFRSLVGVTEFTVGVLLDLAATTLERRLHLVRYLHAERALRAAGLLALGRDGGAAMLDDRVDVVPSVVAALRGEPISPPATTTTERVTLPDELIEVIEAAVPLPRWRAGGLTVLAGPAAERAAVMTLRSALDRKEIWHVNAPVSDAARWCRDSALSGAQLAITSENPSKAADALRRAAARTYASVVIACDPDGLEPSTGDDPPPVLTAALRGTPVDAVSHQVPPGRVRSALETLGF